MAVDSRLRSLHRLQNVHGEKLYGASSFQSDSQGFLSLSLRFQSLLGEICMDELHSVPVSYEHTCQFLKRVFYAYWIYFCFSCDLIVGLHIGADTDIELDDVLR